MTVPKLLGTHQEPVTVLSFDHIFTMKSSPKPSEAGTSIPILQVETAEAQSLSSLSRSLEQSGWWVRVSSAHSRLPSGPSEAALGFVLGIKIFSFFFVLYFIF